MTLPFTPFRQAPPEVGNQYDDDRVLRAHLGRVLPPEMLRAIEPELRELGALTGGELRRMQQEDRLNEPVLTQWNAWGERIDHIEVSPLWKRAAVIAAEKGIVATAFERAHGALSRVHQFALAYLFTQSTDVYSCPLAMTDGAAATLLRSGNQKLIDRAVPRLTSRDPEQAWTSGQWMTESTGGSDVGLSETRAQRDADGTWRLYGKKWFTSATTSQMALTLGRPEGNGPGGHGLALFYVETRDEGGRLRDIVVHRLKDKLGTRKVPTAEITLEGTVAELVGETSGGVRAISPMLNVTRTWNAVSSVAGMRKAISLARDYAKRRVAFGAPLAQKPLHVDTLAEMQAEFEAAFEIAFFVVALIGEDEAGTISEERAQLLRLMTPVMKAVTAKQAVAIASETLEAFGGAGYVEDTGLPTLLRDAQVLPIWEGTTNVLSLDTLRALGKDGGAGLGALRAEIDRCVAATKDPGIGEAAAVAKRAVDHASAWLGETLPKGNDALESGARRFALTLGRATELALLCRAAQHALDHGGDPRPRAAARRFAATRIDLIAAMDADDARRLANDE